MGMSPTSRSLALLRSQGWHCEVVEHWNAFSRKRHDLWGWCDILCLNGERKLRDWATIVAVQTTTKNNMNARIKKIRKSDTFEMVRCCGISVQVHGWHRVGRKWECKIEEL